MTEELKPLALVTGASSGIGYELAKLAAGNGYDLMIAADRPEIVEAAQAFRQLGAKVESLQVDLSTTQGVDRLVEMIGDRPVDVLMANAGHGLGGAFLDEPFDHARHVLDTNVTGTIYLAHKIGRIMRSRGRGRILFTGSIAGLMPGSLQAVDIGAKAFVDRFAWALRNELKETGVSVTCLLPGATETDVLHRARTDDTRIGQSRKDDPADIAKTGFQAMMKGEGDVVLGLKNKAQAAAVVVAPQGALAEMHRGMAEPGSPR